MEVAQAAVSCCVACLELLNRTFMPVFCLFLCLLACWFICFVLLLRHLKQMEPIHLHYRPFLQLHQSLAGPEIPILVTINYIFKRVINVVIPLAQRTSLRSILVYNSINIAIILDPVVWSLNCSPPFILHFHNFCGCVYYLFVCLSAKNSILDGCS